MERLEGQAAISIVKKGNYILLDLRKAKHGRIWEVPGGGMEEGETPEEAVKRETKEEVDIDIKNPMWLGAKNQGIHWINTEINHFFLSTSFSGEPKATDLKDKETLGVKWVKISDIKTMLNVSWRVVDAMYFLSLRFPVLKAEYYRIKNAFDNRAVYSFEQFSYWSGKLSPFYKYKNYLDKRLADKIGSILDRIKAPILQINPGFGEITKRLIEKFGSVDIVELSPESRYHLIKNFGSKVHFIRGIAESFHSNKRYNGIVALNSFIYQPSYILFAQSILSSINPGGKLVFSPLSIKHHILPSSYIAYRHSIKALDSYKQFFADFGLKFDELYSFPLDRLNNIRTDILSFTR
ncbi:NUDIX domain-containing protein [Candidatus Parvarchaeota archaeon]|nr:NUDIX domain-containing protein [Candidatus Parvarchaeota archaeon]